MDGRRGLARGQGEGVSGAAQALPKPGQRLFRSGEKPASLDPIRRIRHVAATGASGSAGADLLANGKLCDDLVSILICQKILIATGTTRRRGDCL
ncbi:hypothetical protein [Pseudomonas citronellolis]|uniref:hypothetical protein n=1 Tax=Pseudomonas citronellolis TaxID=53408 RepID=UPI0023E35DF2|nr:hypothetical protein [Pseudomonas citronellolis]MDF3932106.1 hypothetical protein [Pseudomonas citronellolis]